MSRSWEALLDSAAEKSTSLRDGLALWQPEAGQPFPFRSVECSGGIFTELNYIDWRELYDVRGSTAIYNLDTPFLGLLFYDTIFLGINPCPRSRFDDFHNFQWRDVQRMIEYARKKRVRFFLNARPKEYYSCEYLLPLFEEFQPLHLVYAHTRKAKRGDFPTAFDEVTEQTTDLPYIQAAIHQVASDRHISPDAVDATTCATLQELYYRGHVSVARSALDLLRAEPLQALAFISALRRAIVDPEMAAPGIPHALETAAYRKSIVRADKAIKETQYQLDFRRRIYCGRICSFSEPYQLGRA